MRYKYSVFIGVLLAFVVGTLLFFLPAKQTGTTQSNHASVVTEATTAQHSVGTGQINQIPTNVISEQNDTHTSLGIDMSSDAPWATRTLPFQGKMITYEFGKGNPPEVALTGVALDEYRQDPSKRGYMTPEAEIAMEKFLSSDGFALLQKQCESLIVSQNASRLEQHTKIPIHPNMEYIMYVDKNTGRKEFRDLDLQQIEGFWYSINNPLEDPEKRTWHTCLDPESFRQAESAMELYFDAAGHYNNPL